MYQNAITLARNLSSVLRLLAARGEVKQQSYEISHDNAWYRGNLWTFGNWYIVLARSKE